MQCFAISPEFWPFSMTFRLVAIHENCLVMFVVRHGVFDLPKNGVLLSLFELLIERIADTKHAAFTC